MKKAIGFLALLAALLMLTGTALAENITIDAAHFPDEAFRAYIVERFDTDRNGVLSEKERNAVTAIVVSGSYEEAGDIRSLQGLGYFPKLQTLDCGSNQLASLDVSKNTALTELYCYANQLTSLDVSANRALTVLDCEKNQLTRLDVSANPALTELYCQENQLAGLDVSANPDLQILVCGTNQITSLDLSANSALQWLICYENQLTSLDVSANSALTWLYCYSNHLTSLNVSANPALQWLYCGENQLTSLDVSANSSLEGLQCGGNQLTVTADDGRFDLASLPGFNVKKTSNWKGGTVSGTILTVPAPGDVTYTYNCGKGYSETFTLTFKDSGGTEIPVETGISIDEASFPDEVFRAYVAEKLDTNGSGILSEEEQNAVTSIDVSRSYDASGIIRSLQGIENFPHLQALYCGSNQLKSLDVSANPLLKELYCQDNQLTALDVSAIPMLEVLHCGENQLTSLDVSANSALQALYCYGNQLTCLDVSANSGLEELECDSNQLPVIAEKGKFDLAVLPGFDTAKASDWNGGTVSGTVLSVLAADDVTYTYDCGNGYSETFTLNVSVSGEIEIPVEDGIPVDDAHFPDANFRAYVAEKIDTNGSGVLSEEEQNAVSSIIVKEKNIASLEGIAFFPALEELRCDSNALNSLNVSKNPALNTLNCGSNHLASLDVSANPALRSLSCDSNMLTSLDLSGNSGLKNLSCSWNLLISLDLSGNPALETLNCDTNQLTALDVSANSNLINLSCTMNQLRSLDVRANSALRSLSCGSNLLTSLDLSGNPALETLSCSWNLLTSLDVRANPDLTELECHSARIWITADNGKFDLSTLPGFDVTKTGAWNGGTVEGTILTVPVSGDVTYTYDCGCGYSETFTLGVTVTGEPEPEILPGDVNGDGVVDGRDLLRLARFIAGQDVKIDEKAADLNGDGMVDGRDVLRLAKTLAAL